MERSFDDHNLKLFSDRKWIILSWTFEYCPSVTIQRNYPIYTGDNNRVMLKTVFQTSLETVSEETDFYSVKSKIVSNINSSSL